MPKKLKIKKNMSDIKKITEKIKKFCNDRDWIQFHDSKSMAASIVIEAAELLEHFQWRNRDEVQEYIKKNKKEIGDEIADIAIYLFELTDNLGLDLVKIMEKNLRENNKKYPVKKAKGKHTKYNKL